MINGQLRPTYLHDRGVQARARTSGGDMYSTCSEWMQLARWLHRNGVTDLGDCTAERWRSFIGERLAGLSRTTAAIVCGRLTDLWAFDRLSAAPTGVARTPWETEGVDDFLPAADGGHVENTTEPLDPQVLGPLLAWSIRFVDDFADDILTAWNERRRLIDLAATSKATTTTWAALEDLLLPMIRDRKALPAGAGTHKASLARQYIAALTGASVGQIHRFALQHDLVAAVEQQPGPCRMDVPVRGRLDGRPWREHMDFHETAELMRHLVHRRRSDLPLPDRHAAPGGPEPALRLLPRPAAHRRRRTRTPPDPRPPLQERHRQRRQPRLRRRSPGRPPGRDHTGRQRHPRAGADRALG
ncbi:hypothetical protein [Kitasatospora sp. CB02891]|uniref:hypothetical protein n=1 Tax=Kitasatospora sp. CB02891 TaxID=2020329 RepID=UPI0018E283B8